MRWRGTVISLIVSFALSIFCLGGIDRLTSEIMLMIPYPSPPSEQQAIQEADRAWRADHRLNNTIAEFSILKQRNPTEQELATWRQTDQGTSLPILAELLVRLRTSGVGITTQPSSSTPALDERLPLLLSELRHGPPLHVGAGRFRELFVATLTSRGVSARRAETLVTSFRLYPPMSDYREVIRESSERLFALARAYAASGKPAESSLACQALIRMLTDMVQDSPQPEVALLAAERLPPGLQGVAGTRGNEPMAAAAVSAVETFRRKWMDVLDQEMSLLPMMPLPAPALSAQQGVLQTLVATVCLLAMGWLFAIVCLACLMMVLLTRTFGPMPLVWRWNGWGTAAAPALVVLPALAVVLLLASGTVPYIWLFSVRSLAPVVLLPMVTLLTWMLASLILVRSANVTKPAGPGWPVLAVGTGLVLVAGIASAVLIPLHKEGWQPPPAVQVFRHSAAVVGLASILVMIGWAIWTSRVRRRANIAAGAWARACLAVASSAMAVLLLAATIAMAFNARQDSAHERAFAEAAAHPIADRLGVRWFETYFAPAQSLLDMPASIGLNQPGR